MKRFLALALVVTLVSLGVPTATFAAGKPMQAQNGQVSGTANDQAGQPLANHTVRLRNTANGQIVGTGTTNNGGVFSFANVPQGNYVVELVDASGKIIATSPSLTLATGAMNLSGVAITTSAQSAVAAAGAAGGGFFTSTAGIVLLTAGAAGAAIGIAAAKRNNPPKSPNK